MIEEKEQDNNSGLKKVVDPKVKAKYIYISSPYLSQFSMVKLLTNILANSFL